MKILGERIKGEIPRNLNSLMLKLFINPPKTYGKALFSKRRQTLRHGWSLVQLEGCLSKSPLLP